MIRQSILFALLFVASLQLGAQTPRNITIQGGSAAMRLVPCTDNDAGTITFDVGNFVGQSNDITLDTIYLCFGDTLPVLHAGDFALNGDPNLTTDAGIAYAFYDCRPTVDGPDLTTVLGDPCVNQTNPIIVNGVSIPQTDGIWVAVDDENGNVNLINNGFHQEAFNMGNPAPIQFWFAPITVDNLSLLAYENGGPCVSVSIGEAFSVVYLEAVEVTESFPNAGPGLQGAFSVGGGLPEFQAGTVYSPITITHISGNGLTGTVQTPNPTHSDTVQFTVPRPGEYEVIVEDGKSCAAIDTIEMPVIFSAGTANGAPGDTVCVEVRVDNLVDVTNAQFTLNWDPAILDFVEVGNLNTMLPALDDGAFNTSPGVTDQGQLPFAWLDFLGTGNTLPDGSVLFEACFEVIGALGDNSPVFFSGAPTDIQVGNPNNTPDRYPFDTIPGSVFVTNSVLLVQTAQDSVSCNGLSDGAFTVTVSGGVGPYAFTWNTFPPTGPENGPITISGGTATIGGRPAGEYRVIVTDSDMPANIDTAYVEVLEGPEFAVNVAEQQSPTCFGDSDGSLIANVTINGVAVPNPESLFTFQWDVPGETGRVLANIPSGTHSVTVTDASGCQEIDSGSLSQPAQLQLLAANTFITDATCSGSMDGSILIGATGGTTASGNYTYAWSGGLGTVTANTSQVSNLNPGDYTVTVTDDSNCTLEESYSVTAAKILLINLIGLTDVTCNGAGDGSIEVSGTTTGQGPFGPFTYTWNTVPPSGPNFTGAQVNGLGPAQYAVTVTDSDPAGCAVSDTFTIEEPAPLAIQQVELANETCAGGGNDGRITIGVTGGTYPYSYNWTDGQMDSIAVNLSEGMYTVDVTDANNCTASQSFNITAPTPPQVTQLNDDTLACFDDTNGSLSVLATPGGAPIQSYNWSNGGMGQTINNLGPGAYFVTITATDGCFTVDTALVVAPEPLALDSIVAASPNCPGDDNGSLTVFASGGTMPYTYIWNNQPTNDTLQFNLYPGLTAGNYEVTVVDVNGCTPLTALGTVTDPPAIVIDFNNITEVSCFEGVCDGGATATAMYEGGATGLFDFTWESGEMNMDGMSSSASSLCKDWQTVVVTDANGCFGLDSVLIPSPPEIEVASTLANVSCNGFNDGTVTAIPSGGTPGYTYLWQQTGEATATISGLSAGTYNLVVTDANGCEEPLEVDITEPDPLMISVNTAETLDVSCFGEEDGRLVVTYNSSDMVNEVGPNPYSWSSNTPPGSTSPLGVATNLPAGTYSVTITDVEGCQDSLSYTIMEPSEIVAVVPDPEDPPCFNSTTKVNIDTVYGGAGSTLADYQYMVDGNGILLPVNVAADIFGDGLHDVEVFDPNGCSTVVQVDIDQPDEILVTFPEDPFVVELGDTTRQLQPIITPLSVQLDSFIWSPGDYLSDPTVRNPFVRPLESLEYELTVVDINGCEGFGSVFVELDANRNIYIPNVFSPNGDGVNDEFRVYPCVGVSRVASVNIFDRWGGLVFQSEGQDVSNGLYCIGGLPLWDGRFKGNELKPDVYVYVVEVEFLDGITLAYRGDVSILR